MMGEVGRLEAGVVGMIVVGFTTYAIDGGICAPVRCNRECAVGDGGERIWSVGVIITG